MENITSAAQTKKSLNLTNGAKKRRKRNREVSMSDIMPKFENTQSIMMEQTMSNNINYNSTINNLNYGRGP